MLNYQVVGLYRLGTFPEIVLTLPECLHCRFYRLFCSPLFS